MKHRSFDTPFGPLRVSVRDAAIVRITWAETSNPDDDPVLEQAGREIAEYVAGQRQSFDLPVHVAASGFQQDVCAAMQAIPFGETRTYGDIAKSLNVTPQAVGQACGANPIPVVIPCHRVMGANGRLVGFSGAGGVETKVALLRHEGAGGFLL